VAGELGRAHQPRPVASLPRPPRVREYELQ
jgi:hypothetical protein